MKKLMQKKLCKWFDLYTKEDLDWVCKHWFKIGYDIGWERGSPDQFTVNTDTK